MSEWFILCPVCGEKMTETRMMRCEKMQQDVPMPVCKACETKAEEAQKVIEKHIRETTERLKDALVAQEPQRFTVEQVVGWVRWNYTPDSQYCKDLIDNITDECDGLAAHARKEDEG